MSNNFPNVVYLTKNGMIVDTPLGGLDSTYRKLISDGMFNEHQVEHLKAIKYIRADFFREMIRDAVGDERQRCVDMFVKWGMENLSLHDLELLEHFVTDRLEGK